MGTHGLLTLQPNKQNTRVLTKVNQSKKHKCQECLPAQEKTELALPTRQLKLAT
jgi:hypothetical protein